MSTVPTITLNNGVDIPQLGLGVFQVEPGNAEEVTRQALEIGYRHIDTAQMYGNERGVGKAVRESGIPREEIFVTSKLSNAHHGVAAATSAFEKSLDRLGLDVMDLFLIHWPLPRIDRYVETWRALSEVLATGRVRAIGVSNFHQEHLQRLFAETDVVPAVNQFEVSPYLAQDPLRAFCAEHGIAVEAWSPIAKGKVADDPELQLIGREVDRTPVQVTLRWHIQRGDIVFPKSVQPDRMRENFDVFDFQLSDEQMERITSLDRDERTGPHPDEFHWMPKG